jgi:hypothetical protein
MYAQKIPLDSHESTRSWTPLRVAVGISYAHVEYSASEENTVVAFHPGVFQGIVFIHREAMVKEGDS